MSLNCILLLIGLGAGGFLSMEALANPEEGKLQDTNSLLWKEDSIAIQNVVNVMVDGRERVPGIGSLIIATPEKKHRIIFPGTMLRASVIDKNNFELYTQSVVDELQQARAIRFQKEAGKWYITNILQETEHDGTVCIGDCKEILEINWKVSLDTVSDYHKDIELPLCQDYAVHYGHSPVPKIWYECRYAYELDSLKKLIQVAYERDKVFPFEKLELAEWQCYMERHHPITAENYTSYVDIGWYLLQASPQGEDSYKTAKLILNSVLEVNPNYPQAWLLAGDLYYVKGLKQEASDAYRKYVVLSKRTGKGKEILPYVYKRF